MTAAAALAPPPRSASELAERMPDAHGVDSDEPQMETTYHQRQLVLLQTTLEWHWRERRDFFIGANLSVYYDRHELRRRRFLGPDFFLVRGVSPEQRRSWVVWEEGGRYPDLVIELLSDSTAQTDRTDKRQLYQNVFRTPEYIWFDPIGGELECLRLDAHRRYEPIERSPQGLHWSEVLELHLGVVDGVLRYFDSDGVPVPTAPESALAEHRRAEEALRLARTERQRAQDALHLAQTERQRALDAERLAQSQSERAQRLAARLRELGIDPDATD